MATSTSPGRRRRTSTASPGRPTAPGSGTSLPGTSLPTAIGDHAVAAASDAARRESDARPGRRPGLVHPQLKIPFVLLLLCFASWGVTSQLSDVLVGVFRGIFSMSNFQSALVQFAYYGAYFTLAIPASIINKRFGYKVGVLSGLGLAAVGSVLFWPASQNLVYGYFLCALFVLAAGLSILETSANPFVIAMGPEDTGTRRLNLAQAFNPVGSNLGVLIGAVFILPRVTSAAAKKSMSTSQLQASQHHDLSLVLVPYLGIAAVLIIIWVLIATRKMPTPAEENEHELAGGAGVRGVVGRLWSNTHYRYGVAAQFCNVGAQTCAWTFTIQYAHDVAGATTAHSGWYLQASLILFLVARFVMTYLLGKFRPTKLLLAMGALGVVLCVVGVLVPDHVGLLAVVGISLSLSLMFPTIYGVALQGLGEDTKFGAAGLVMAILGGALLPLLHGKVADLGGTNVGFVVPAVALALVAGYALFDLRSGRRPGHDAVAVPAH